MRFRLLALLGVAVLAVVSVWLLRSPDRADLVDCAGLVGNEAKETCLVALMTREGSPAGAAGALSAAMVDEQTLLSCHEAAHTAGLDLYENAAQVASFLTDPSAGVCDWGLVHGLLGSLVLDDAARDEVPQLLVVCAEVPDTGAQQACGDSVGHAFFEIDRDFLSGARRCLTVTDAVAYSCVSGVFMQMYRPVAPSSEPGSNWSPPLEQGEVHALCAAAGVDLQEFCAGAAYYTTAPAMQDARDRVLATSDRTSEMVETFVPVYRSALEFCGGFPAPGDRRCAGEVVRYALQMMRYLPAAAVEEAICRDPAAAPSLKLCRQAAAALLN